MPTKYIDNLQSSEHRLLIYDELLKCMLKGGAGTELAISTLYLYYEYYKEKDITKEELEERVLEAHQVLLATQGYVSKRNIQQEVDNFLTFCANGSNISVADIYQNLHVTTKEEKNACRMALNRLSSKGLIEKIDSGRTGTYRKINIDLEEMKYLTSPKGEFNIKLPLELNTMCKIFPKSIIIIAGSKSSGKTAMLMNIAIDNQDRCPVTYLNSDMGEEEYTERLFKMGCNTPEDVRFKTYNRSKDFHDIITPDKKIFIVDFLEIHDNFYEIGKHIKLIWEKLKEGVAIIAIQMKSGATVGRGGDFSKEKARLYLTLDYDQDKQCTKIIIEDMKSPKDPDGYKGWWRNVKIINGAKLKPWKDENGDVKGWQRGAEDYGKKKTALPFSRYV
jgi:hypothetical protein